MSLFGIREMSALPERRGANVDLNDVNRRRFILTETTTTTADDWRPQRRDDVTTTPVKTKKNFSNKSILFLTEFLLILVRTERSETIVA